MDPAFGAVRRVVSRVDVALVTTVIFFKDLNKLNGMMIPR